MLQRARQLILLEELAILFCEEYITPPPGGFDLEIVGPGGATLHAHAPDAMSTVFADGLLDDPDLRISLRRETYDRLIPDGGALHGLLHETSRGFSLRLDHLAGLLNSPRLATWCARGGTLVCRLAEAPDATLSIRFAPARDPRACVLTFPLDALCGWLRREISGADLAARASVGGPDVELARLLAEDLR